MRKFLCGLFYITLLLLVGNHCAWSALCKLNTAQAVLNISDDITLNPAEKGVSGTVLWSKTYSVPNIAYICDTDIQSTWISEYSRTYMISAIDDVYNTEVPGIGVRIKWPISGAGSGIWMPGNSGKPIACNTQCSIEGSTVLVEFVQIGTLSAGTNAIPAGEMAKVNVVPVSNTSDKLKIMSLNFNTAIKVVTRSCSIIPSTTTVDLGTYSVASFENSTSFDGTEKEFSITMTCPVATAVSLKLSSTINPPFGASSGVLGVESGDGYAKNFTIRLFENKAGKPAVILNKDVDYTVDTMLTKKYLAKIIVAGGANRKTDLSAGKVSGAIQYTMLIN